MKQLISIVILILVGVTAAQAAPFTLDENIKPLELKYGPAPDHPGSLWTGANGTLGDKPHYITVGEMSPYRIQMATLFALGKGSLTMNVVKNTWNENLKSCTAQPGESCDVEFSTFGDASFKITGDKGATYRFILLAGPEHPMDEILPSPLRPVSKEEIDDMGKGGVQEAHSTSSGGDNFQTIVIGLLVVLILIVLAGVIVMARKKSTLQSLILLVCLGASLAPYVAHAGDDGGDTPLPPPPFGIHDKGTDGGTDGGSILPIPLDTEHALAALEAMDSRFKVLEQVRDFSKARLSKCDVIGNPPQTPQIPSLCAGNRDCQACYSDARTDFNNARAKLEKLRLIYTCSQDFSKAAIAFGDSVSGIHPMAGLAWQDQKFGILKSVKGLKEAYDGKYAELIGKLHDSMIKMGTCEAKFGSPDWYDRFGYTYYEFMADKYKRAD